MNIQETSNSPWAIRCDEKQPPSSENAYFACTSDHRLFAWSSPKDSMTEREDTPITCNDDAHWGWKSPAKNTIIHALLGYHKALKERKTATKAKTDSADRFTTLNSKWKEGIGAESSLSRITGSIHYLGIIGMGMDAVPAILRDLQETGAPWFVALEAITGRAGIGSEYPGNFKKKRELWLQWGREQGYI